jgi:hypothetical protein
MPWSYRRLRTRPGWVMSTNNIAAHQSVLLGSSPSLGSPWLHSSYAKTPCAPIKFAPRMSATKGQACSALSHTVSRLMSQFGCHQPVQAPGRPPSTCEAVSNSPLNPKFLERWRHLRLVDSVGRTGRAQQVRRRVWQSFSLLLIG